MGEDSFRKQSTISALSNATILHDPTLVEDLSELRNIPRITSDEGDQSVSGSVVITKRIPPVETEADPHSMNNTTDNSNAESQEPIRTSMASSHYSDNDTSILENEEKVENELQKSPHHQSTEHFNAKDMDQLELQLDQEISDSRDDQDTTTHINHHLDDSSVDFNQTQTDDLEYPDSIPRVRGEEVDDEQDLNMEYSDSDFEDNLEQRMMHMGVDNETDSLHPSEKTVTPLHSGSTTPNYEYSDDDYDNMSHDNEVSQNVQESSNQTSISENDEEEEDYDEAEDEEDYQPLPPPQELDPDKLYALYVFNGPDPSHCQLEQDEPCILLNDEDTYWWLVKRCRDNNIGFAPAEILETFPERLARLNCWKNENMTSSTVNSAQSIDIINQNEREQQEKLEVDKHSSLESPYQPGKNDKSVSFNDIVSYANRYVENGSESDDTVSDNNSDVDDDELSSKVKEDNKTTKYNHIDKFTNEVISYSKRSDKDENNSDVVSDVSFNTGYTQPLNMVKIRESKSIKNIHNAIIDETPKRHDEVNKWSDVQGLGITDADSHIQQEASDSEGTEGLDANEKEDKAGTEDNGDEQESTNTSMTELHKVFEAPIIPFGKDSENKMKKSNSDYSISTIGEFSPSSSEWTNDSPNLKDTSSGETTGENVFNDKFDPSNIPSTKAVQDISQLVEQSPSPKKDQNDELDTNQSSIGMLQNVNPHESSPVAPPCSSSSETVSSAEKEFKMFMQDDELLASTTSVTSNNSSRKNQTIGYMSGPTTDKSPTNGNSITNDTFPPDPATYQHPLVQQIYEPIVSKIDTLLTKIDELVQQ